MSNHQNDDAIPEESSYPYAWSACENPSLSITEFVAKYRPSMIQDDGSKPWIWVHGDKKPSKEEDADRAIGEASDLLDEVTEKIKNIQDDPNIPIRANKKKGTKSKKELREAEQKQATEKLQEISTRTGYVTGKWLVFSPAERVDSTWASIATSLISGPLSKTEAFAAKVATSPNNDTPSYQHVTCIYLPNVYDKNAVTEVLKVLLRHHGLSTNGVKSDLYTHIGLDSKHPSGIPSTVWKNSAILAEAEIKRLKDEYFEELKTNKAPQTGQGESPQSSASLTGSQEKTKLQAKGKDAPRLKRKASEDDPFASDSDNEPDDEGATQTRESQNSEDQPKSKKFRT